MLLPFVAQGATITLGPASLSYPDLAAVLTKAGMATEAAPELADRGAFVCLKGRKAEEVRAVLGEALGVAFVAKGAGWRMVADPAAKAREANFLDLYRRQAVEKAKEVVATQDALLAGRDYAAVDRDVRAAAKTFEKLPEPPDAATKARLRRLFALSVALNPSAWTGLGLFRDPAAVAAAIAGPVTRRVPAEAGLPTDGSKTLAVSLAYDPATGTMGTDARGVAADGTTVGLPPYAFEAQIGAVSRLGHGGRGRGAGRGRDPR